jgi:hypothetical protein
MSAQLFHVPHRHPHAIIQHSIASRRYPSLRVGQLAVKSAGIVRIPIGPCEFAARGVAFTDEVLKSAERVHIDRRWLQEKKA